MASLLAALGAGGLGCSGEQADSNIGGTLGGDSGGTTGRASGLSTGSGGATTVGASSGGTSAGAATTGGAVSSTGALTSSTGDASGGEGSSGGLPDAGNDTGSAMSTEGGVHENTGGGGDASAAMPDGARRDAGMVDAVGGTTGTSGGLDGSGGNCGLPSTVGFKKDVQPFLITACGGGNGCHVVDTSNNHAYDWITDFTHSPCPDATVKRFQIVMPLVTQANPSVCPRARLMPPPDATGAGHRSPLTSCQIATLQAWLNEPLVDQMHNRNGFTYPMPPYN